MRRKRGEGSITKRSDGRYQIKVPLGKNELGKPAYLYGYEHDEKAAVRRKGKLLLEARRRRSSPANELPRLFGPTIDLFLEHVRLHREPNTHRIYESYARRHVKPALGRVARDDLSSLMVQRFLNGKLEAGLSKNTVRGLWVLVTAVLTWAEGHGGAENVARRVEKPRPEFAPENILTLDEAHRLLGSIKGHRLYALFLAAVVLGQRQSSLLGLSWPDIPEDYSRVRLLRKLIRVKGAWLLRPVASSRTKKAPRALPLPRPVADALREHRARQERDREQAGSGWCDVEHDGRTVELVFTSRNGTPLWASTVEYQFYRCLEQAGLERRRFHDLRHSAASVMIALGIPIEVVSQVLAHAGIQITNDLYVHLKDDFLREQLMVLDAAWGERESAG